VSENHSTAGKLYVLLRCFSYHHRANLFPIIPASFQQFSEKECGKQPRTIAAMQQSCVFWRFAHGKVRALAHHKK
jgi:hypothetical protein